MSLETLVIDALEIDALAMDVLVMEALVSSIHQRVPAGPSVPIHSEPDRRSWLSFLTRSQFIFANPSNSRERSLKASRYHLRKPKLLSVTFGDGDPDLCLEWTDPLN